MFLNLFINFAVKYYELKIIFKTTFMLFNNRDLQYSVIGSKLGSRSQRVEVLFIKERLMKVNSETFSGLGFAL